MLIPTGAWIILADSGRYLVMENIGKAAEPRLVLRQSAEHDLPPEHDTGTDRPGRMSSPATPKSAFEDTDWRRLAKADWARELADVINGLASGGACNALVLAAAPGTLGDLRPHLDDAVRQIMIAELAKDLTKHHVKDVERLLAAA